MKLAFTKYKGLTFDEVIEKDPRFARWFLRTFRGTGKDKGYYLFDNTDELLRIINNSIEKQEAKPIYI